MTQTDSSGEPTVRVTPTGILAAAFLKLVDDAKPDAWWRQSGLLAATGLAYHLDELGYEIRPKASSPTDDTEGLRAAREGALRAALAHATGYVAYPNAQMEAFLGSLAERGYTVAPISSEVKP